MATNDAQFRKVLKTARNAEKIKRHLKELATQLKAAYQELETLTQLLNKEAEDYEALEKLSIKAIFYKVLGSKAEQMEKERQEYLQASLKYDEVKKSIDLMEYEQNILKEKLTTLGNVKEQLDRLWMDREKSLIKENGKQAKKLLQLNQQLENNLSLIKETREAIIAGESAQKVFLSMISALKTAKNWGNWDMATKGKSIAGYAKHTNIDKARAQVPQAKQALRHFENELRDIFQGQESFAFSFQVNSFSRFTDIFFDNLISDWVVQRRIKNAMASVQSTHDKIHRLVGSITARIPQIKKENRAIRKQKKEILSL
ncbi:MAG: hypothetical protein AB8G15_18005 [Saprospiraceae bacterium]